MKKTISIRGAKTHNLKNISVDIPRDKLVVITGVSGSGKSSLAFDTIYAEGQRRYVESLSSYARQFLSMMEKPDVEHIEGLSPAISIEQKSTSHNPRSTVGTVTEIYDYLRLLFARSGTAHCPTHTFPLDAQTPSQIVDAILEKKELGEDKKWMLIAPILKDKKSDGELIFEDLKRKGFTRVKVNGDVFELSETPKLNKKTKNQIGVVVDRFRIKDEEGFRQRLSESVELVLSVSDGEVVLEEMVDQDQKKTSESKVEFVFSSKFSCPTCGYSVSEIEPRIFSFNAPSGACQECDGLGKSFYFDEEKIIPDTSLSIDKGAIIGWGKDNPGKYVIMETLAKHFGFSLSTPWKSLSKKHQEIILLGSGSEKIHFNYLIGFSRTHPFEGILSNLQRKYKEADPEGKSDFVRFMSDTACPSCLGGRINEAARNVFINNKNLPQLCGLPVSEALPYFKSLTIPGRKGEVAEKILKEIVERLSFLENVGLGYISLDRQADTLSGGEAQRIRLASQIGAGLVGVMYVLDEPSIGLHQRDNEKLLSTLFRLRDLGNTVIVVEHDEDAIRSADFILDIGPAAGVHGGEVVASGSIENILSESKSITGQYLSGKKEILVPKKRRKGSGKEIKIFGASGNNLKNIDVAFPLGTMTCVTGVSGSGKSTLVNDTLHNLAATKVNKVPHASKPYKSVSGLEHIDKVVNIDQSPIGRTPRSNPATYTGLFTPLRELFSQVPEARARGYAPGRFSFNVRGGRCESCQGDGVIKVEMHFLPDVYVTCDVCQGKRYNRETLDIKYKGLGIDQVLNLTVEDALSIFSSVPSIKSKLQTLADVGLSYIKLGQSATTLSGGEAQRMKLAKELSKKGTGSTLYILDEPTTGLHFHDIDHLLTILHRLVEKGNSVVVIEHNLDVIKTADWIIDMGPEGGRGGGEVLIAGTPEGVARSDRSVTGVFLKKVLAAGQKNHEVKEVVSEKVNKRIAGKKESAVSPSNEVKKSKTKNPRVKSPTKKK